MEWFSPILFGQLWARQASGYTGIPDTDITAKASRAPVLAKWLATIAMSAFAERARVPQGGGMSSADAPDPRRGRDDQRDAASRSPKASQAAGVPPGRYDSRSSRMSASSNNRQPMAVKRTRSSCVG